MDARLIHDAAASGSWNMAVDESLFQGVDDGGAAVLRLYEWSEPTLSLGYFQCAADRAEHPSSLGLPLVRRSTGGGAIVHDRELTYCLVAPLTGQPFAAARRILDAVHESLAEVLRELGVPIRRAAPHSRPAAAVEPFLCFLRRAREDLLLGDVKVVGSAQRRLRQALLQHGSVLLRRSPAAPELAGIEDITPVGGLKHHLVDNWPARLADRLAWSASVSALTTDERQRAGDIETARFAANRWNLKR
jgi:lipoate-protein ligase A